MISLSEASRGFEPLMRVLQTLALPLGHDAIYTMRIADWTCSNPQPSMFERAMGFEPTTFSLARRRTTTVLRPRFLGDITSRECRDPGSNWGHRDFQSRALPTELSRQMYSFVKRPWFYTHLYRLSRKVLSNQFRTDFCYSASWLFVIGSI